MHEKNSQNYCRMFRSLCMRFFVDGVESIFPLDYILRDGLYQRPRGVSGDIKIIGIDERTLERLGPVGTWSRSCYADLLDRLNEDEETRPLVIGFDIIFSGNVDEEGDQAFADRAEKGGNVVTASQLLYSEKAEMDENGIPYYRITGEVLPYEALRKAAISGYTNVAQDSDGTVRRILVEQDYKGESRMMFSQVIYNRYCDEKKIEPETVKQDKTGRTLINYSGKPGDYEYISFVDVLDGKIDTRIFKDCIVLVGAYAGIYAGKIFRKRKSLYSGYTGGTFLCPGAFSVSENENSRSDYSPGGIRFCRAGSMYRAQQQRYHRQYSVRTAYAYRLLHILSGIPLSCSKAEAAKGIECLQKICGAAGCGGNRKEG